MKKASRVIIRILRGLLCVVIVAAVLGIALQFAIVPAVIRWQINENLSEVWAGRADVGTIQFNFFGPTHFRSVELLDECDQKWAEVDDIEFRLSNWPSLHPVLTEIHISRLAMSLHVADDKCDLPTKTPSEGPSAIGSYVDLQKFTVGDISLTAIEGSRVRGSLERLSFVSQKRGQDYEFLLSRRPLNKDEALAISGAINFDTLDSRINVSLLQYISGPESAPLVAAMEVPWLEQIAGTISANLTLTGNLGKPEELRPNGTLNLSDCKVTADSGTIADKAALALEVNGYSGRISDGRIMTNAFSAELGEIPIAYDPKSKRIKAEAQNLVVSPDDSKPYEPFWSDLLAKTTLKGVIKVSGPVTIAPTEAQSFLCDLRVDAKLENLTVNAAAKPLNITNLRFNQAILRHDYIEVNDAEANSCGGRAECSLKAGMSPNKPLEYWLKFMADGIEMGELTVALAGKPHIKEGTGHADIVMNGSNFEAKTIYGRGLIFIDEADMWETPILNPIFKYIGVVTDRKPLYRSDMETVFKLAGPVVVFKRAQLANPVSAIEVEEGGTMDLSSGQLDFYVIAVPVRDIRTIMQVVPFVNLFVSLRDKLTRLHVKGHWSEEPSKLVTKETVADVREGTVDFLRSVVNSGGQFSHDIMKTFHNVFESLGGGEQHDDSKK